MNEIGYTTVVRICNYSACDMEIINKKIKYSSFFMFVLIVDLKFPFSSPPPPFFISSINFCTFHRAWVGQRGTWKRSRFEFRCEHFVVFSGAMSILRFSSILCAGAERNLRGAMPAFFQSLSGWYSFQSIWLTYFFHYFPVSDKCYRA